MKANIVRIGLMGRDKTTVGKLVTKKLRLKFLDIERELERMLI